MKSIRLLLPCLLGMVVQSCSTEENEIIVENKEKCQVLFTIDDFIPESLTRTNCDPTNGYAITWATGDAIGIFPREGDQEPFVIPVEQVGLSKAAFDGGYWALKDGKTYNAYYPFSRENYASSDMKTKIPISYLGQSQTGRECNVGAFDYTYSDWRTSVGGAGVNFSFHHIGSFLVLNLSIPANATYTALTLNTGSAVIPTSGTYDLTASTPEFVAKTKASSLSMQLKNFIGVAGEIATFYMMVPPMDLSAETLTVTLSTASSSCTYSVESKNILAAKLYNLTGTPKNSNITGTVDSWFPVDDTPYLTFTCLSSQTLMMSEAVATLEYSVDNGEWAELGTNKINFGGSYGDLRLRGKSSTGTGNLQTHYSTIKFNNSGNLVDCTGDIRTLVDYENYSTVDTRNARFALLFSGAAVLRSAPSLPSETLATGCYQGMFMGCTWLTSAPNLPAMTLKSNCYNNMFAACTWLASAPELPATTLADYCYQGMFDGCEHLTTAPDLPATTLGIACYNNMFSGCNRLEVPPTLPATTLTSSCYSGMFQNCTSLACAPVLPATSLKSSCYQNMFNGCTKLNTVIMKATYISASNCLNNWLYNVAPSGTFTKNANATWSNENVIPSGWTVFSE